MKVRSRLLRPATGFVAGWFALLAAWAAWADDWPQWRGPQRDGVWRETGIVERFESDRLELAWSVPVGSGYSGPTVADGRVFVTDRVVEPEQLERVLCFDAVTGAKLWSYDYPAAYVGIGYTAGPRASVTVDDQHRAYALGAMGHLHVLDAGTGVVLWQRDLQADFDIDMPMWGLAAAPLVVGDLLILQIGGSNGACIVALDRRSGDELWRALDDRPQYSAPVLIEQAGTPVVVVWTGDSVAGLALDDGQVYWRYPLPASRMPIGVATPVVDGERLFVTSFYDGSLMLRLAQDRLAVERIWRRVGRDEHNTEALHSIISTPLLRGDYLYGVDSHGELRCLDAWTGERIWEDQTATPRGRWSTIHFVEHGERVWMFNEQGELIIAELSPGGFRELSRARLIEPTLEQLRQRGGVAWSHPAFANRMVFARNDERLVAASLAR